MINGPSGLLNIGPEGDRPKYEPSRRRLIWPNGAEGHVFSAEDPDSLRGPQFDTAWADDFGYHPNDGSGDVYFHLDALWAHPDIDAVAIDWYAPLSDWRDGGTHLDAVGADSVHDPDYLAANVEGGEGYDWFYSSQADRDAQVRSEIRDGAHGKPWVFRYKDIRNWWSNPHYARRGGAELGQASLWVPESKPVWFTEIGCPAVDKGANQPNVFIDPKSSESFMPYYSNGSRDDLIQRRYIEAHLNYWSTSSDDNPVSSVYGDFMIDPDHIHVWTWDARPFPDFPVREDVWSDGENWRLGHWLNGRMGLAPLGSVVDDIATRTGLELVSENLDGLISGFVIDRPMAARDAIAPLSIAFGFSIVDRSTGAVAIQAFKQPAQPINPSKLLLAEAGILRENRSDTHERPKDVRLGFQLDSADYRVSMVYARREINDLEAVHEIQLPLLADEVTARDWAETILQQTHSRSSLWSFGLPPSCLAIEAGDALSIEERDLVVQSRSGGETSEIEAVAHRPGFGLHRGSLPEDVSPPVTPPSSPELVLMDLALLPSEAGDRNGPLAAVFADPWPGDSAIWVGESDSAMTERLLISKPAIIGEILSTSGTVPEGRWIMTASLVVKLTQGMLASQSRLDVLKGRNRLAVEGLSGWHSIQFRFSELIGPETYRLSGLLADHTGSRAELAPGSRCVLIDSAVSPLALHAEERGAPLFATVLPAGRPPSLAGSDSQAFLYSGADLAPLPVVHLKGCRTAGGFLFSWQRRVRFGGDDWVSPSLPVYEDSERYRVDFLTSGDVFHSLETSTAILTISDTELGETLGSDLIGFSVSVRQVSGRYGPGDAAEISVTAP